MLLIRAIRPEGLVVLGSDGIEVTIPIADDSAKNASAGGTKPAGSVPMGAPGTAPVTPNLSGDIGNGMAVQPMDNGQNGGGGQNGRRRGRNRGQ
jgi:hypothetical protein